MQSDLWEHYSIELVRHVYNRCEAKSVLSGETNHMSLCMACKPKKPKTEADLVIVTSSEAWQLSRSKTEEDRLKIFAKKEDNNQ